MLFCYISNIITNPIDVNTICYSFVTYTHSTVIYMLHFGILLNIIYHFLLFLLYNLYCFILETKKALLTQNLSTFSFSKTTYPACGKCQTLIKLIRHCLSGRAPYFIAWQTLKLPVINNSIKTKNYHPTFEYAASS